MFYLVQLESTIIAVSNEKARNKEFRQRFDGWSSTSDTLPGILQETTSSSPLPYLSDAFAFAADPLTFSYRVLPSIIIGNVSRYVPRRTNGLISSRKYGNRPMFLQFEWSFLSLKFNLYFSRAVERLLLYVETRASLVLSSHPS